MPAYYSDLVHRKTAVYWLRDKDGNALYVGLTCNPRGRLSKHAMREWWPQVTDIDIEWYEGREGAKDRERWAIVWDKPLHNITGVVR